MKRCSATIFQAFEFSRVQSKSQMIDFAMDLVSLFDVGEDTRIGVIVRDTLPSSERSLVSPRVSTTKPSRSLESTTARLPSASWTGFRPLTMSVAFVYSELKIKSNKKCYLKSLKKLP